MKLLVNTPTGAQELIEIGEGGGYFDATLVIWDERNDGDVPVITLGGMVREGNDLIFSQARMDQHLLALRPLVPASVSPRQIRQALTRAGLRTSVEAAVAESDADTRDWYEFATEFQRASPVVAALGAALSVSDAQLDDLWTLASTL